jgi:aldehyde:ferredoxin oxidoreductase
MAESGSRRRQDMNPFQSFYNMKIGVVDLAAMSAETIPPDQDQIVKNLGGAVMNRAIFDQYQGDTLIFGTGPLTGSFAPASSLMIATFQSPRFEHPCHVPFMMRTGPDMKFSGIDFLAVKGTAPELSVLYVNNGTIRILPAGTIRILPAGNLRDRPVPEVVRELKKTAPFFQSSLITGPAADHSVSSASVSIGSKGSLDKAGLASLMAAKNLKGILFGGTGGLPFNKDNPDMGRALEQRISTDKNFKKRGFASVIKNLEGGKDASKFLKPSRKKDMACYHCPSPCMTHVTFSRQYPETKEVNKGEDGLLLLDHGGYVTLAGKAGKNILPVLQRCLYYGLDPAGVAEQLPAGGTPAECLNALDAIVSNTLPYAGETPKTQDPFGGSIPPFLTEDIGEKRTALAMTLGVCPIFLLRFQQITDTDLLTFISPNEDALKTMQQEGLSPAIDSLFTV